MNNEHSENIIDIATYAKTGKTPPKGEKYKIQIKNQNYTVDVEEMTGRQILELANQNPPENFILDMILRGGGSKEIQLGEIVSFLTPGIERFTYVSRGQTEG